MNKKLITCNLFKIEKINVYLEYALNKWNTLYSNKLSDKLFLSNATAFLLNCLDESINLVEECISNGVDKKSTVLLIMTYLFDKIISNSMPIYLKPFNILIKKFVINILLSILIDFIVNKYNNGSWKNKGVKNET